MIDVTKLPNVKTLNVAMLGLLSRYFDLPTSVWLEVIREVLPAKLHAANESAFQSCRQSA
jgi:indolepyruvate ferredoxin oxidoreductase beta subunit